jgi:putative lipoprotein
LRRLFLVLFVLLFSFASLAVTGYDKFLHYSVSYTAFGLSSFILGDTGGFLFSAFLGVGKEVWDLFSRKGSAEIEDLIADFAGIASAYSFVHSLPFRPIVVFMLVF